MDDKQVKHIENEYQRVDPNSNISAITLNVNDLNIPIKIQILSEYI